MLDAVAHPLPPGDDGEGGLYKEVLAAVHQDQPEEE